MSDPLELAAPQTAPVRASKVSGLLEEALAPEIIAGINAPILARSFAPSLEGFARINRAHLVMLVETGLVEPPVAAAILGGIATLEAEGAAGFTLDPEREDAWFNYEAELTRRVGPEAGRLHMARSRNDLKSTLDRLRARALTTALLEGALAVRGALIARSGALEAVVMPGYTHLQHAQPMTLGWYLLGLEAALARDCGRLEDALARMDRSPLGAGAMAGTGFPIDRARTAALLGFAGPEAHPLDAIASRDALIEMGTAAAQLALTLGRMAQDFYLWSSHEFGMLAFPDRIAITSSIMPQKKNLAVLEHLKSRPAALAGAVTTALAAGRAVPFGHSQEIGTETGRWLWEAVEELAGMLPAARLLVECARPRTGRMAALAGANFATATALADLLAQQASMTFREAHHVVGRFVRHAMAGEAPVAALEAASREIAGRPTGLAPEALARVLDPRGVLEAPGNGPNLRETRRLAGLAQAALAAAEARAAARAAVLEAADAALTAAVAAVGATAAREAGQ